VVRCNIHYTGRYVSATNCKIVQYVLTHCPSCPPVPFLPGNQAGPPKIPDTSTLGHPDGQTQLWLGPEGRTLSVPTPSKCSRWGSDCPSVAPQDFPRENWQRAEWFGVNAQLCHPASVCSLCDTG
jgi:hypothetical protein